jgi:hypothetical protein
MWSNAVQVKTVNILYGICLLYSYIVTSLYYNSLLCVYHVRLVRLLLKFCDDGL